jgi:hypothetical protein
MARPKPPLTAKQVIHALGGQTVLAEALGAGRSAVGNWISDGIPPRYWPPIARLAAKRADTRHITIEELERHVRGARLLDEQAA